MTNQASIDELEAEIKEYNDERDRIRQMLGRIGGTTDIRRHKLLNWAILAVTVGLFVLEMTTHILPTLISLEVGLLLISLKIIMLIQSILKQNHFEFWMLHSIEYRINELNKRVIGIENNYINRQDQDAGNKEKEED